ncbi:tetratricopeptide repeat protein [Aquimarina litoralis]|uniref:tetratricopeptide repeat protein n=1 Tax=Aquimarina litoralis TaxID=584605 RepID=UPI001C55DD5D|nr:tetratricopeptide repeat protein [Aquimarina litoralis]MBW1296412.1 hypothetical protein [Aquimarina litoralis]
MNKDDLLYNYFANSLTKAQEELFNNLLATDAEFKAQFEYESNVKRVTKEKRNQDLRAKLNTFESDIKKKKKESTSSGFLYWKIAASIALLLSAGWFGYQYFFGIDYEKLYSANFEIYPNTEYDLERSTEENSLEREAFLAYGKEKYQKAITKFNAATPKEYFPFYIAQSYTALNKYQKAKELYVSIIKKDQRFVAEAHWYLALIYLHERNNVEARKHLKIIINNYNYNKEKAITLYEKLK